MSFTDFSFVENQVKPLPCNYMYNHALGVYIDKFTSSGYSSILGTGKQLDLKVVDSCQGFCKVPL